MIRRLPWLVVLFGLVYAGSRLAEQEEVQGTRFAAYRLSGEEVLRLPLWEGERQVRLLTWLGGPAAYSADARLREPYCLLAEVVDGEEVHAERLWLRTRTTWTAPFRKATEGSARLLGEDEDFLWDGRRSVIPISLSRKSGELRISACDPEQPAVYVVAHRAVMRTGAERYAHMATSTGRDEVEAALGLVYEDVPDLWRDRVLADRWERISALERAPDADLVDFETQLGWQASTARATVMLAGQRLVWNVRQGASVELTGHTPDGEPAEFQVEELGVDGRLQSHLVKDGAVRLEIDQAASSVIAMASEEIQLVARIEGGADKNFGVPPREDTSEKQRTAPDFRSLSMTRVNADLGAIWHVDSSRHHRVEVRIPLAADALDEGVSAAEHAQISLVFRDESDAVVQEWQYEARVVASAYERYSSVDDPTTAVASEGHQIWVVLPSSVRSVEVRSDRLVDVRVQSRIPDREQVESFPGYELPDDAVAHARYVPRVRSRWAHLNPEDVGVLTLAGRQPYIDAQVRFELDQWTQARLDATGASPQKHAQRRLDLPLAWLQIAHTTTGTPRASDRTRLGPDPQSLTPSKTGRIRVQYEVDADLVGQELTVRVDGEARPVTLLASGGQFRLDEVADGAQVGVESPGLFLADVPGEWRIRRVYGLRPGRTHRIATPSDAGHSLTIQAFGRDPEIQVESVGGPPSGLYERRPVSTRLLTPRRLWAQVERVDHDGSTLRAFASQVVRVDGFERELAVRNTSTRTVYLSYASSWARPSRHESAWTEAP